MRGFVDKRGQFFILAAVIISSIILSIGATSNYALVSENQRDFEDFSFEIKKEAGAVVDYSVYSGFSDDSDLQDFLDLLSIYVADKEPEASFMFIYGDSKSITIENHGTGAADLEASDDSDSAAAGRSKIKSNITIGGVSKDVFQTYDDLGGVGSKVVLDNDGAGFGAGDKIDIKILNRAFSFPISKHKQVIFLIQKEEGNEVYISAK